MTHEDAIQLAEAWLKAKNTTLWLNWDITESDERRAGAEWFIGSMTEFMDFVEEQPS